MHTYIHICIHIHINTIYALHMHNTYIHTCIHTYTYEYNICLTYNQSCNTLHACVFVYVCLCVCVHVCIYVYTLSSFCFSLSHFWSKQQHIAYMCICLCVYTYTHTYIHTYTHIPYQASVSLSQFWSKPRCSYCQGEELFALLCMCACMYICMSVCMYVCRSRNTSIVKEGGFSHCCVCVHVCLYVCMYVEAAMLLLSRGGAFKLLCMCAYMFICIHVCQSCQEEELFKLQCMYMYVYAYIHTYIHTYMCVCM